MSRFILNVNAEFGTPTSRNPSTNGAWVHGSADQGCGAVLGLPGSKYRRRHARGRCARRGGARERLPRGAGHGLRFLDAVVVRARFPGHGGGLAGLPWSEVLWAGATG